MTVPNWIRGGALAASIFVVLAATPSAADTTLWLVRPLYPGQEALVARTERALDKLITGDARKDTLIGPRELAQTLRGRRLDEVPCWSGPTRCVDPTDAFVASLGVDRVVLVQGGQDEAGFKFRVAAYEPHAGKATPAQATNSVLEKALLGAIVKVFPAASTLEVHSVPAGATVFIDDAKAGLTPLSTQVLPGEHLVRLDLKLHQPVEETITVPFRGQVGINKALEKVAARIVVTARPAGTVITVDGQEAGRDRVDRGIAPGEHVIRLSAEGHKGFEQTITVKPDEQFTLDRALEPVTPPRDTGAVEKVKVPLPDVPPSPVEPTTTPQQAANPVFQPKPNTNPAFSSTPPPPPPPPGETEKGYERRSFFQVGFTRADFLGNSLVARRWGTAGTGRTETFSTARPQLVGAEVEYGTSGKYFGVSVVGLTYLTNTSTVGMNIGWAPGSTGPERFSGVPGPTVLDEMKFHLIHLRALQPQLRLCFWRFQLTLQAGLEFRSGLISGVSTNPLLNPYTDGFQPVDLLATGRVGLRASLLDGLFIYGAGDYWYFLFGETTATSVRSSGAWGFNAGVGYGF